MIRLAGCFLVIGATTLWGMEKSKRLKNRYDNMKYLQRVICLLQSEIRYSRSFLGEIFCHIGQGVKEPYHSWLLDMSEKAKGYTEDSFDEIWRKSVDNHLNTIGFLSVELDTLKSLGNQLGFADVQIQIRLLDLYLEHLEKTMHDLQEEMKTKTRIYHCLGVMSGLLISILLL